MKRGTLLIFTKHPLAGQVKTRLARHIGEAAALRVYGQLLTRAQAAADALAGVERQVWFADCVPESAAWKALGSPGAGRWEPGYLHIRQEEGDLGEKMDAAFRAAFASGNGPCVIMGCDCPDLDTAVLESAFRALETHDYVLGPAADGGYYLLGMQAYSPALFQKKAWSTATVAQDTLADIAALGRTVSLLPVLHDIDEPEDLMYYARKGVHFISTE